MYIYDGIFLTSFLTLNNINIKNIYYFERIHNINFKLFLYGHINKLYKDDLYINETEITKLSEVFSAILYLPNVYNNASLLSDLMDIYMGYYRNYDITDFKKSVEMLCNDIGRYYLPLYNSLFFMILNFYCEIHNINIKDITKEVSLNVYSGLNIYYALLNNGEDQVEKFKIFKNLMAEEKEYNKKQKNKQIYYLVNRIINSSFNFDRLNKENIVKNINIINKGILNDISNISYYKLSLKEFILKVNNLKLEESDI